MSQNHLSGKKSPQIVDLDNFHGGITSITAISSYQVDLELWTDVHNQLLQAGSDTLLVQGQV